MNAYATVAEYRADTCDGVTDEVALTQELAVLSVRLRAEVGITREQELSEDALTLARALVVDAARKKFAFGGAIGMDVPAGVKSFSQEADGFSESVTVHNASGSAYWDNTMLAEFRQLVCKPKQGIGWVVI